jgi:hypothetical protein
VIQQNVVRRRGRTLAALLGTVALTALAARGASAAVATPDAALTRPHAPRSNAAGRAAASHLAPAPRIDSLRRDSGPRPVSAPHVDSLRRDSIGAGRDSIGRTVDDTLLAGRSGKLKARLVSRARSLRIPSLERLFGDSSYGAPGVHEVKDSTGRALLSLITLVPFDQKESGRLGTYRMGFWPAEKRTARSSAYENPEGFIEVTRDNQNTPISEHFRLRDFLTKDQGDVWPKYLVLREELVDKLELIIDDLGTRGIKVRRMVVMSGFRTPQYNQQGVGRRGGRATDSRHQFGDAADVFVDNNGDGRMDDLNRDGRVNARDAQIIIDAASRVEARHPSLMGGAGRYKATRAHGPFAHIDVRGTRARWGTG